MIAMIWAAALAAPTLDPLPPELPTLPERAPAKKVKLKGLEVPPGLWTFFELELTPTLDEPSREESLKVLDMMKGKKQHQVAVHLQAMKAQRTIEPVRPVVLTGLIHEDHAASLLDAWVPENISKERRQVFNTVLWRDAVPACNKALLAYEDGLKAAEEVGDAKSLRIAKAGVARMMPADGSIEAQLAACSRAYNF